MIFNEFPQKSQIWRSETSPNQGTWLEIPCLGLVLGFLRVFFKYPKISKNANLLFFPVEPALLNPTCNFDSNLGGGGGGRVL